MTAKKREPKAKPPKGVRTYWVVRCTTCLTYVGATGETLPPDKSKRHLFGQQATAEKAALQHGRQHVTIETLKAIVKKRTEYEITEVPER